MRPVFLHLDDALLAQRSLHARGREADAIEIDARRLGPQLRLWSSRAPYDRLNDLLDDRLPANDGPMLVFAGSGDFHHVSALLIARAVIVARGPLTVIHVDNHPDWVRFGGGGVHCGSWVGRAARLPGVVRLITIGVCSSDVRQPRRKGADLDLITDGDVELYTWSAPRNADTFTICGVERPTRLTLGEDGFRKHLLGRISTHDVYVTIDKDALSTQDAATNWDQGQMHLAELRRLIAAIGAAHRVVGADIVGDWSKPIYGGAWRERIRKRVEAMIDQPRRHPDARYARTLNERANLSLLDCFARASA